MPGFITVRPIQADLNHAKSFLGTFDPYCQVELGNKRAKSHICKKGGATPSWDDKIVIDREDEMFCLLEIKDKETLIRDKTIGTARIDFDQALTNGSSARWYDVYSNDEIEGQILVETIFTPGQSEGSM